MKTLLSFVIATLGCAVLGCGGAQSKPAADPAPTPAAAAAAPAPAPAPAVTPPAGEVKCPVSGEGFTPSATSPSSEYNGKTYYFCCPGCKKKFDADPAKFAANPAPAKAADAKPCGGDCATGKPCADCADKEGAKKAETK
ncbi:MAG: YHS domain-containing protein [Deltaproteobacteria bacterium]|nr:YHS domain-containing protein [Deltaproteobacteria bacterium]